MRSIGTRFVVVVGLLALMFSGLILARGWLSAQRHIEELTALQARLALEFDLAIRDYVAESIRPAMQERIADDEFVVEAMSTSYVARQVFERVGRAFPDYVIKFSSMNPRNPVNLAGKEERALIRYLEKNPEVTEWNGRLWMNDKEYYAYLSPMRITESCLPCHGRPEDAPRSMVERYGATAGFGRRVGEVAGVDMIGIPVDRVQSGLWAEARTDLLTTAIWLLVLFGGIYVAFQRIVKRRLTTVTAHFRTAAAKETDAPFGELRVEGEDEISVLATSYNRLMRRLRGLQVSLEQRVAARTGELASANAQLARAKEAAEAASHSKSLFLANMSHEIRTPMTAVLGMNDLMLDTVLTAEQREYAETIHQSAQSLLGLLNDILDFSKIEAGKLALENLPFDLRRCVESAALTFAPRAAEKGLELSLWIDPELPARVCGDPGRLQQILLNLISNAVKFTESGEVAVRVEPGHAADGEEFRVRFAVRDTGVGISVEEQARLLRPFAQADVSTTRRYGGTGLGLAICQRLTALMGGALQVDSVPGQGTAIAFWVNLPAEAGVGVAARPRPLAGVKVLVVAPTDSGREVFRSYLTAWGGEVTEAANTKVALAILKRNGANAGSFAVIVVEHCRPRQDGPKAVRRLRQEPALRSARWVLVVSVTDRVATEQLAELGADLCLSRPVRHDGLLADLSELLHRSPGAVAGATATDPAGVKRRMGLGETVRVLVAEDTKPNQMLLRRLLQKAGYACEVVSNGREALRAVEREPYDLVLMDCQMPEMDGYEATQAIRRREGGSRHLVIIALTASAMKGDREACLAAGMDDYLTKPVVRENLLRVLQRWTGRGGQGREPHADEVDAGTTKRLGPVGGQAAPDPGPDRAPLGPAAMGGPVDFEALKRMVGDDPGMLKELWVAFEDEAGKRIGAMAERVTAGDSAAVRRAAHALKSSALSLQASSLAGLAGELEGRAQAEQLGHAGSLVEAIRSEFAAVRQRFEALG